MKTEFIQMFLKETQPSLYTAIEKCYKGEGREDAYQAFGREFQKEIKKYIKKVLKKHWYLLATML